MVKSSRRIVWVCLTVLWGWRLQWRVNGSLKNYNVQDSQDWCIIFSCMKCKHSTDENYYRVETIFLKSFEGFLRNQGFSIFFNNWFSTMNLIFQLKKIEPWL